MPSGRSTDPEIDPDRQKAAAQAIGKALDLSIKEPENEQAYIRALAKRYSTDPKADVKKLGLDYKVAMGEVARRYPDDLDAATLYAESAMDLRPWQLWTADGQPAEGTLEIIETLKSVLRRDPEHIGANHYYIHATEASPHPEQARESARRLAGLAPAAGHLVQMPSHLYIRAGDYHAASLANEEAAAADRAYVEKYHVKSMYGAMYYSHNIHFLAVSSSMEGRFAEANAAAKELEARVTPFVAQMPMADWFVPTQMFVLVRFRKWMNVEALPEPAVGLRLARAFWRFGRGMAASGTGRLERAESESAAMKKEVEAIPADAHMGFNSAHQLLEIAGEMLDASIARAKGDYARAAGLLRKAALLEDALNYDEPPDWYLPPRESLGAVLMADHKPDEAETAFRQELKAHAANPRAVRTGAMPQSGRARRRRKTGKRGFRRSVEIRRHGAKAGSAVTAIPYTERARCPAP